jgi:hypothetical protein
MEPKISGEKSGDTRFSTVSYLKKQHGVRELPNAVFRILGAPSDSPCFWFLRTSATDVHGGCTAGVIEYLQTTMEAVARDSIGEDVQLNSHFGSELLGRLPWRISALEVERCDFV